MTIDHLYKIYLEYPSVQTDTRKLKDGDLFFALKGDHFNGNTFVEKALEAGAAYAIIDEPAYAVFGKTIVVPDVLLTLQELALHHRNQFNIPFLAITGSNGKTTTKELIHAVLSTTYKTYTTEGNLNNHIGIPLTILKIKNDAEIAVIEMGANHQKEIESYCRYAKPTHGIITNCGKAHLEGFGGVEGVKKGKGELFDYLRAHDGTVFIMQDYDYLLSMSRGINKIITYGTTEADMEGQLIKSEPYLEMKISKGAAIPTLTTQLVGEYNLPNILAAITVGKYFQVKDEAIKNAIENYTPSNSRSQLLIAGTNHIILDAYNANPSSMRLAINNFAKLHATNKILLLGSMAELGEESLEEHRQIIELIGQYEWEAVALVGNEFARIEHPYHQFNNALEAREWYHAQQFEDAYVLIKGSRSMRMETVIAS